MIHILLLIAGIIGFLILIAGGLCAAASRNLPVSNQGHEESEAHSGCRITGKTPRPSEDDAGTISTPTTP